MKRLACASVAFIALAAATSAFAGSGNPASDTATASATVISPLTVTKVDDLVFGKVVQPTAGSGTATIAASSGATIVLSGLTAPSAQGTKPAHFTISGDSTTAWTAALTAPATLSGAVSGTIGFAATTSTLTGSPTNFYVGGTITVSETSTPQTYSGTLTLTATYN